MSEINKNKDNNNNNNDSNNSNSNKIKGLPKREQICSVVLAAIS